GAPRALAEPRARAALFLRLLPRAGDAGRRSLRPGAPRLLQPEPRPRARRVGRRRALAPRRRRRVRRRPAASALQGRPGEQREDDAWRALALFAPPELFLPVADLDRLRADRSRSSLGLDRVRLGAADPLPDPLRHWDPAVRRAGLETARRLRRLPAGDERV